MEEKQLLQKYRDTKDQTHLARLYKPYMPLVYGSCLKYLKNEQDAQDAVMDIFEKLVKKALTHKIEYFKSWIFIVTRNHCFEKLRRKTSHQEKENAAELMYSGEVFHPDSVNKDAQVTVLHECMDKLEEHQRSCIKLFYFKKMSYAEIAESISLNFNQVRSRIQNGRRNLKTCLEANAHRMEQE